MLAGDSIAWAAPPSGILVPLVVSSVDLTLGRGNPPPRQLDPTAVACGRRPSVAHPV